MTIGFVGLGAEAGYWFVIKKKLQNVADAAVYAAAVEVRADKDLTTAQAAAEAIRVRISGLPSNNKVEVIEIFPATKYTTGVLAKKEGTIVVATATVPAMFSALYRKDNTVTISSRAAAVLSPGANTCILGLQKTGIAVNFSGNGTTTLVGCDVHSNSVANNSLTIQGNSLVTTGCVAASGGVVTTTTGLTLTQCTKSVTLAPQITDPFASLPAPTIPSSCAVPISTGGNGTGNTALLTLVPGKYGSGCYSLNNMSGNVEMRPGVYVIDGGSFKINAGANVTSVAFGGDPEGVTIYLINGAKLEFNGAATIKLKAQTTGTYGGILFFGDRTGSAVEHKINGTASSTFTGVIYTPNDNVTFTGDNDPAGPDPCTLIISNTVEVSGNAKFGSNCTGSALVMPRTLQVISIVE